MTLNKSAVEYEIVKYCLTHSPVLSQSIPDPQSLRHSKTHHPRYKMKHYRSIFKLKVLNQKVHRRLAKVPHSQRKQSSNLIFSISNGSSVASELIIVWVAKLVKTCLATRMVLVSRQNANTITFTIFNSIFNIPIFHSRWR
jgi:hypothetical protein